MIQEAAFAQNFHENKPGKRQNEQSEEKGNGQD
jgi:hypothetical protein